MAVKLMMNRNEKIKNNELKQVVEKNYLKTLAQIAHVLFFETVGS